MWKANANRDPSKAIFVLGLGRPCRAGARSLGEAERVFLIDGHLGAERQDAQDAHAGARFEELDARVEQTDVAAKLVDDEADDALAVVGLEQLPGSDDLRKDAPALDVGHEDNRGARMTRHSNVGQVVFGEIDLDGAACPFEHDDLVLQGKTIISLRHARPDCRFRRIIFARRHQTDRRAVDDDLAHAPHRLEQDRIHVDRRLDSRSLRLRDLCAADLAAVASDEAVQGHVLCLERRDPHTPLGKQSAKRRRQYALADMARRSKNHQRPGAAATTSRSMMGQAGRGHAAGPAAHPPARWQRSP